MFRSLDVYNAHKLSRRNMVDTMQLGQRLKLSWATSLLDCITLPGLY